MDDIEALKQLKARYCRTMDTKDWAAMRQLFTDDVTVDTVASGGTVMTGADDFLTFLVGTIGDVVTVHQCHTPEIRAHFRRHSRGYLGHGGHAAFSRRLGTARVWPLPRDLCGAGRGVADQLLHADPAADGFHAGTGDVTRGRAR